MKLRKGPYKATSLIDHNKNLDLYSIWKGSEHQSSDGQPANPIFIKFVAHETEDEKTVFHIGDNFFMVDDGDDEIYSCKEVEVE